MKLKFFIIPLMLVLSISAISQNSSQIKLVKSYFSNYGGYILQDLAHPVCSWNNVSVQTFANHTYYVTLYYDQVLTSRIFSCEYLLKLNSAGKFISIRSTRCGSPNSNCFGTCRWADLDEITTYDDRIRYEGYVGKSLEWMTCENYTNVKLFFDWYDRRYYAAY